MRPIKTITRTNQSKKNTGDRIYSLNSSLIFTFLIILSVGVILQMARWQIFEKDRFTALAQAQYLESQRHPSSRGIIYAADSTILATDQPSWDIYASLSSIKEERDTFFNEKDKYVATVSSILEVPKEDINSLLTEDFRFVPLKYNSDTDTKKALEEIQIFENKAPGFGLYFEKSEKRIYPNGSLASHILGFMGRTNEGEDIGLYGIEGFYFGDLTGTEGFTYEEKDAFGNVILTSEYEPVLPREGKDIKLTIIPSLQSKIEDLIEKGVNEHQAKSGSVILMDPKTGAILSMANYPDYNPNEYWRIQDSWIFKNKAVGDVYEPGSVFKPITVAIGLETDTIEEDTVCNDATGYVKVYEGRSDEAIIYTWDKLPDGNITPEQFLQYSNNPCIAQTAQQIGLSKYYPLMQEFGIGNFVGIGLQDEANSYLKPQDKYIELDLMTTAFGQSVPVTSLQMISAISTIANNGKRMKPYIVEEVTDDSETITYSPRVMATPISEETADSVANMMRSVVRKGDASWIFNKFLTEYDIAGKTGTAQIPKEHEAGYYEDKTNAIFIGFAPVEDPKMIMIVRLEEPGLDPYAATTAVPVWVDIFLEIADDLEIPKK